jgi:hypothetical protein
MILRTPKFFSAILFLVLLLVNSCETAYRPTLMRLDPVGTNSKKATAEDLVLFVEEYATVSKSKRAFDTNLAEVGILPMLVLIENRGNEPYEISLLQIIDQKGEYLKLLTPDEAANKAKRLGLRETLGWSLVVPIVTIPIAAGVSAMNTVNVNSKVSRDFGQKGLSQDKLPAGQHRTGFLFYQFDEDRKNLSGLTFKISARKGTSDSFAVSISLDDISIDH